MQLSQSKCSLKANEGRWIYIWVNSMKLYQALRHVDKFRTVFDFGGREVAHWFPGHMAKGDSFGFTLAVKCGL